MVDTVSGNVIHDVWRSGIHSVSLKRKITGHWKSGLACGIATALAGVLFLTVSPFSIWMENLSYDFSFLFARTSAAADLVLVEMDETSLRELKQTYGKWDRSLFARLIDRLTMDDAKLIVLDVFLADPGEPAQNAQLAEAIKRNGRVVLPVEYQESRNPILAGGEPIFPRDEFRDAAGDSLGISLVELSEDRIIRTIYSGSDGIPSLAWTAAAKLGAPATREASRRLARRWLRYYGPPDGFPGNTRRISFSDALRQEAGYFHNKVIFVGGKPRTKMQGEEADVFATPYSRFGGGFQSGVTIQAIAFINLMRGDWLTRLSPLLQFVMILFSGLLLGFLFSLQRPISSAVSAVICMILVFAAALVLASFGNLWFSWMAIAGAQVPFALGLSVLNNTRRLQRDKEAARKALQREKEIVDRLLPGNDEVVVVPDVGPGGTVKLPEAISDAVPTRTDASSASSAVVPSENANPHPSAESTRWIPPSVPDHTLIKCIGEGAYGQVWLAQDVIGTHHAVKFIYRKSFSTAIPFDREFRGIQKFTPISRSHPGFVHVLHVGRSEAGQYFFYVMELGDDAKTGQRVDPANYSPKTLATMIKTDGKLPVRQCVEVGMVLTSALEYLHQHHLIHRDIKPSNIIFVNGEPKFADVGLVTNFDSKRESATYLGTEGYIAPEGPGTPSADIYSLGKVLYEITMGKDRMQFPDLPTAVFDNADPMLIKLNAIILKACESNPKARYQSAVEMHKDLGLLQRS